MRSSNHWIPLLTFLLVGLASLFSYLSKSSKKVHRRNYPKYCSKSEQVAQRAIPPVNKRNIGNDAVATQILQVFSVYRHGARTPERPVVCWDNYDTLSRGFEWDCDLQSLQSPSIGVRRQGRLFAFSKHFDALKSPKKTKRSRENEGTCHIPQLTNEAYDQMFETGRLMRNAYITTDKMEMKLFESARYEDLPYKRSSYFRSLENSMVMMSGHMLVSGVFDIPNGAIVDIHTIPKAAEAKARKCPTMITAKKKAKESTEYMDGILSSTPRKFKTSVEKVLKEPKDDVGMIDCLMTTYCTDRELPSAINDFVSDGDDSVFNSLIRWKTWKKTFHLTYNDGEFSKLAAKPFWEEIVEILNTTKDAKTLDELQSLDQPRFFSFSSNGPMVIAVLVSMGGHVWDHMLIPYASNVIIEHHVITSGPDADFPSEHAFRLLWDGEVITERMDRCDTDLCDLGILLDRVEPLLNRNCGTNTKG